MLSNLFAICFPHYPKCLGFSRNNSALHVSLPVSLFVTLCLLMHYLQVRYVYIWAPMPPGKSQKVMDFFLSFQGLGKSWKLSLES